MQDFHTNNLIESWHNVLKSVHIKDTRKRRTNLLVHRLLNEVLIDLRKKVTQISLGFNQGEQISRKGNSMIYVELFLTK